MNSGMPLRRILVVTSTYPRHRDDFLPKFVHELCRRLVADFEVHVLAPSTPGAAAYEQMDSVHVHRFRYFLRRFETLANVEGLLPALKAKPWRALLLPFFFLAEIWMVGRLARRYNASVVHAHWILPQGFAVLLSLRLWRLNIPSIVTCHGADLFALNGAAFKFIKRNVLTNASAVTVVSRAAQIQALKLGAHRDHLFIYPMGVDLKNRFTPNPHVVRDPATILFVGRLNEKKGADVLIRAVPIVRKEILAAKLEIVGYGPDRASLEQLASELSITNSIIFHGAIEQSSLPDFYRRATCLVFPSVIARSGDQEGLGLVPIEALGCGCPVIASRLPAVADVISNEQTGWLFEPGDHVDLARKIVYALRHRRQAIQVARSGRAVVKAKNDWRPATEAYARLFQSLLGNAATTGMPLNN